jgi:ubiquinone/menaquinone biosynthesis C-methylase UbiE
MSDFAADRVFSGPVPKLYETYLVPLIFQPYAIDLSERVAARPVRRVLEIAAGTGVVTRRLAARLPASASIVATDLNQPMLDQAAAVGTVRPVTWQQADVMALPFPDESFDAVVCQFGIMFFPDKARAFAEMHRVLEPGGRLVFNAWDRIEENHFADEVTNGLARYFPYDPPRFMARTPHGYHDVASIRRDLAAGGFMQAAGIETLTLRSRTALPRNPAIAYCQGTSLRGEIEARDPAGVEPATRAAEAALAARFGPGPIEGQIQAHIVTVAR